MNEFLKDLCDAAVNVLKNDSSLTEFSFSCNKNLISSKQEALDLSVYVASMLDCLVVFEYMEDEVLVIVIRKSNQGGLNCDI